MNIYNKPFQLMIRLNMKLMILIGKLQKYQKSPKKYTIT